MKTNLTYKTIKMTEKLSKKLLSIIITVVIIISVMTVSVTTASATSETFTVSSISNAAFFSSYEAQISKNAKQIRVIYSLQCEKDVLNTQWYISYDSSVLCPRLENNTPQSICPEIGNKAVYSLNRDDYRRNIKRITFSAVDLSLFDFSSKKKVFANIVFDIVGNNPKDTTISFIMDTLGVSKINENGVTDIEEEEYIFNNCTLYNCDFKHSSSTLIQEVTDNTYLQVNASSNYFPSVVTDYNKNTKQITVAYLLQSEKNVLDTEWSIYYDSSVLVPAKDNSGNNINTPSTICPQMVSGAGPINFYGSTNSKYYGYKSIRYSSSNITLFDYSKPRTIFAKVVFDVVTDHPEITDVYLDVRVLRVSSINPETGATSSQNEITLVNNSKVYNADIKVKRITETIKCGDVDGDGELSIMDATEIQKFIAGMSEKINDNQALTCADINADGYVNIIDATIIQKIIANLANL